MDSNSLLTSIMQLAERSKRNLRAAPGQIADQISNFVPDWQATSAAVPSAIKSSAGKTNEEVFKKAIEETAGNAIPGGAGAAGIFIGPKSPLFNTSFAKQALDMLRNKIPEKDVWRKYGTGLGVDGKLRQEISDNSAQLISQGYTKEGLEGFILHHPKLAQAYPELPQGFDLRLFLDPKAKNNSGVFDPISGKMKVIGKDKDRLASVGLHELQHKVQSIEDYARGGSTALFDKDGIFGNRQLIDLMNSFRKEAKKEYETAVKAYQRLPIGSSERHAAQEVATAKARELGATSLDGMYRRLAGEVEARNTQYRQFMTPEERLFNFFKDTADTPIDKQVIMFRDSITNKPRLK